MAPASAVEPSDFIGGHPALDFHNTVSWESAGLRNDRLGTFADLARWARAAGLVTAVEAHALERDAEGDPVRAAAVLAEARELRGVLHDILSALAQASAPPAARLAALNAVLRTALPTLALAWDADHFEWRAGDHLALDTLLARLAWSAAQLLTAGNLTRLRQCANPECGWLFLDTTRNWSRRWCSMADCGSRAKARRYYQRKRERADAEPQEGERGDGEHADGARAAGGGDTRPK